MVTLCGLAVPAVIVAGNEQVTPVGRLEGQLNVTLLVNGFPSSLVSFNVAEVFWPGFAVAGVVVKVAVKF